MKLSNQFWKQINHKKDFSNHHHTFEVFTPFKSDNKVLVSVDNISQIYKMASKNPKVIFENVSFDIYEGDRVALLGANGAGKTTLVEMIAGFKNPTKGLIKKHFNSDLPVSKQIGVQFQDLSFPKSLKVSDIIKFVVNIDDSKVTEQELENIINVFEINEFLNLKVSKISGGQQQRLNVLLSLITKPVLLFLDEFTTGLDIASKNKIKDFIVEFTKANNINIVLISHDIDTMADMVNRVILIGDKKKLIDASIDDVNQKFGSFSKMTHEYIK